MAFVVSLSVTLCMASGSQYDVEFIRLDDTSIDNPLISIHMYSFERDHPLCLVARIFIQNKGNLCNKDKLATFTYSKDVLHMNLPF